MAIVRFNVFSTRVTMEIGNTFYRNSIIEHDDNRTVKRSVTGNIENWRSNKRIYTLIADGKEQGQIDGYVKDGDFHISRAEKYDEEANGYSVLSPVYRSMIKDLIEAGVTSLSVTCTSRLAYLLSKRYGFTASSGETLEQLKEMSGEKSDYAYGPFEAHRAIPMRKTLESDEVL